jgi:HK97 family phage portal protein
VKLRDFLPRWGQKAPQLTYDQVASLIDGVGGRMVAGVSVTDKTALQVSTVLACVKTIADGCATPNLHVFRELDDGTRQKATNIPEYRLLNRRANEWQTSFEWRRQMTIHAALTGTGLSVKVMGDNRRVRELIPIMPGQWDVRRISRYEVRYRAWDEFGMVGEFTPSQVFVLNGVQWDWLASLNAVHLARQAIGLAIATERSQAAFHENGMRTSGTYSVEGQLTQEQHQRLSAFLKAQHMGSDKSGAPLILDRNAKWNPTAMSGVDAQHVETRRLQIEEICRMYGVFPIMVGHSDKSATFASSEAFFAAHVKHTLAPWHRAWTQRLDEMLLDGSGPLFAEFDTRYMMAGSMKDRAQWARTMAEMGIYTRNEIRDEEGKDPLPGLDKPLTPMNMGGSAPDANEGNSDDPEDDPSA